MQTPAEKASIERNRSRDPFANVCGGIRDPQDRQNSKFCSIETQRLGNRPDGKGFWACASLNCSLCPSVTSVVNRIHNNLGPGEDRPLRSRRSTEEHGGIQGETQVSESCRKGKDQVSVPASVSLQTPRNYRLRVSASTEAFGFDTMPNVRSWFITGRTYLGRVWNIVC